MRTLFSSVLISVSFAIPTQGYSELENNALYQWNTENGTPTYSPDPPPKGVKYTVVGADLQPLAKQPAPSAGIQKPDVNNTVTTANSANTKTRPIQTPAPKWKPVRYANAPAANTQLVVQRKKAVETTSTPTPTPTTIAYESDNCLAIKRDKLVLESQFSRAQTDAEMDQAVLSLREKSIEYNQKCKSQRY